MSRVTEALRTTRVVPVVEITEVGRAAALARALLEGGIATVEVTLRTPIALDAIREIAREVPDMCVGAGTVLDPEQAAQAVAAGAEFLVAPGFAPEISAVAERSDVPYIPGAVTSTEIMQAMLRGHRVLKFFPAEASGGVAVLRSLAGPLAHTGVQFMPTGGITSANLAEYLGIPSVLAVGGTWIATRDDIAGGHFTRIEQNAREAMAAVQSPPPHTPQ